MGRPRARAGPVARGWERDTGARGALSPRNGAPVTKTRGRGVRIRARAGSYRRVPRCQWLRLRFGHGCPYEIREGPAVLPLHRVRLADGQMARPLRRMPGMGD